MVSPLQISKVAYYKGMVVSTCRSCKNYHLIADNERKLDMGGDYGPRIDEFLASKGETVQKLTMSLKELEENYLVDKDGVLSIIPKSSGQVRFGRSSSFLILAFIVKTLL